MRFITFTRQLLTKRFKPFSKDEGTATVCEADQNVAQINNLCYDEFEFNLKSDI